MKAEKDIPTKTAGPAAKRGVKKQAATRKERPAALSQARVAIAAVLVVIAAFAAFYFLVLPSMSNVPFTTFKGNFDSAARVALVVEYGNQSQYSLESQCFPVLVQALAFSRNASTIDFFILNSTTCYYPSAGLGHPSNVTTSAPAGCLAKAGSEPALFLNYSAANRSVVKAYDLYVYGNAAYMAKCPIAVDLS
jgi:hypothetical protein